MSLLESLIVISEKAANIARSCRQEKHLFELLVEEKGNAESNPRFVRDFKTLADVLIQECVIYDIGNKFPNLQNSIKGEENNTFCNTLGETICVEIQHDLNATAKLLEKVLDGNKKAANLLAEQIHKDILLRDVHTCESIIPDIELNHNTVGVWIDPIDSTAEYINGQESLATNKIYASGLRCVTVLIGVFDKITGNPLIGVVNQPFANFVENKWVGHCHWGVSTPSKSICCHTSQLAETQTNIVCLSSSEDEDIKTKLKLNDFTIVEAAGAGYKILTVIDGFADAYVLSKDTTFKWDTCGPQAILRSLGGNILTYTSAIENSWETVNYSCDNTDDDNENKVYKYCNYGGIIAYRNKSTCITVLKALSM